MYLVASISNGFSTHQMASHCLLARQFDCSKTERWLMRRNERLPEKTLDVDIDIDADSNFDFHGRQYTWLLYCLPKLKQTVAIKRVRDVKWSIELNCLRLGFRRHLKKIIFSLWLAYLAVLKTHKFCCSLVLSGDFEYLILMTFWRQKYGTL